MVCQGLAEVSQVMAITDYFADWMATNAIIYAPSQTYDPATGKSFLVADALTAESAAPVLLHEVGIHAAKDASMKLVFDRAQFLVANAPGEFFDRVRERMGSAGETSAEEAAAYLAETEVAALPPYQ